MSHSPSLFLTHPISLSALVPCTSLSNLAYGQVLASPRPTKKNKSGFGRYKSSKSGLRKRGRPPKNFIKVGEKEISELESEIETGENEIGDFDNEYHIGDECVTPSESEIRNEENMIFDDILSNNVNKTENCPLENIISNKDNDKIEHKKIVKNENEKTENIKRKNSSVHFDPIENFIT